MAIASTLVYHNRNNLVRDSLKPMSTRVGLALPPKKVFNYMVKGENDSFHVCLFKKPNPREFTVSVNGAKYQVKTPAFEFYRRRLRLSIDDESPMFRLEYEGNFIWTAFRGVARTFEIYSPKEWRLSKYMPETTDAPIEKYVPCPMPGLVLSILISEGDRVYRGQDLVSIESMKMESFVASPCDGLVDEVVVKPGQAVETGDTLLTFK
jgi:propionyl-CoA carboxylase alpha chain